MLNTENTMKCRRLLNRYGYRHQLTILIEECSELIKEVCKMFRNGTCATPAPEAFKEELVDVLIMAHEAVMICGISEAEINRRAAEKLDRALKRMEQD